MDSVVVQIFGIVCGCLSTIVATLYGFKRAGELFEKKLEDKLVTKIDRDTYTTKVKELHDQINSANIQLAKQDVEISHLKEKIVEIGTRS